LAPRRPMDFDFNLIPVPFGMRPGLRRVTDGSAQLTPLAPGSALAAEKIAVWQAGQSRHAVPGFDPAPALRAIGAHAALAGCPIAAQDPPELAFEEDLAVLDGAAGTLPWLCVCVPSHWAPEDKVGLDFAALHGPVADSAALIAASRQLVALATGGDCWERHVWTVSPSARYDQHPRRHARAPWPVTDDPAAFAAQCWLRAERQTFFPVGQGTQQAVFTIRVMLQPLTEAVAAPWQAQRLRDSLASMSPAVLAYKNLAAAREPLLRWLDTRI
jgi:dimethylamine monooxygenase subunit A